MYCYNEEKYLLLCASIPADSVMSRFMKSDQLKGEFIFAPEVVTRLARPLAAFFIFLAPSSSLAYNSTSLPEEAPSWKVRRVDQPGVSWRVGQLDNPDSTADDSSPRRTDPGAAALSLGPRRLPPSTSPGPNWSFEPLGPPAAPYTPPTNAQPPKAAPLLSLRSISRGVSVNGHPYPDTSIYVPNGYAQDREAFLSFGLNGTSRIRYCSTANQPWLNCSDAELMLELTPFRGENASFGFNWTLQSLTGRNQGTRAFIDAQSLGFRAAFNLTPTIGFAIGGEQVLHLDNKTDLGHNFYAVLTQAIPLGSGEKPPVLIATNGVGTDFFAYGGNGSLGTINCGGGNSLTSTTWPKGSDCKLGPISSLSLALNDRFAIGAEWFGYGIGAGISMRPLGDVPLTLTLYATDFLGNYPSYIAETCPNGVCTARYYGRFTLSF